MSKSKELADQFALLKLKKKNLEREAADVEKEIRELERVLVETMELEELQNFKDDDGRTFFLKSDIYLKKTNETALFNWLKNMGAGDAIKYSIHPETLKSIIRGELEKGLVEIPGVETTFVTKIGLRGLNKTKEA